MFEKNLERRLGILMGGFILFAIFFALLGRFLPDQFEESSQSPIEDWAQARVSSHLYHQAKEIELKQAQRREQNKWLAPEVGQRIAPGPLKGRQNLSSGIDHSPDINEGNAAHDMHKDRKVLEMYNPNNQINSELADQQKIQEYNEAYREAYVRQFLANARAAGFEVTLDKDYRVINVRQILKSQGGAAR